MSTTLTNIKWVTLLLAGMAVHLFWNLALVALPYGLQDVTLIDEIKDSLVGIPMLTALLTVPAAMLVARAAPRGSAHLHGLLVGVVAGLIGIFFGSPLSSLIGFVLAILAGWLGGIAVTQNS